MKKNFLTIACSILLAGTQPLIAQRSYDEVITTDNKIQDLVQNEITGVLVFKEGSTIKGINPDTKKIAWTLTKEDFGVTSATDILTDPDFGTIFKQKRDLSSVPNSPYVEAYINSKYLIINTETGKLVYNSSKESFWVFQSDFIPESNEYLLTLKSGENMAIALLDMQTGGIKWNTTVSKAKSLLSFSLKESANTNIAKINGNTIYYLLYGKLYSFDKSSGKLNWTAEEEYTKFFPTQNDKNLVVVNSKGLMSSKQYLNVLNTENGKSIWSESIKTKRVVYLEDWGTKLLVAHYSGFNFFDLKTGEKIWKKDARGDGLKRVIPIDQDFLYVAENEMMLINKNGEKLWKSFIEIADEKEDPIYYLGKVGDKVMYLTGTYGNMVDYKSGRKLWKRNIKFNNNRPVLPTYDENSNSYLVYNDEELYKFDPSIDDKPEPFAKVNIKREKELNSIELFPWGVVLSGPVEVMGVGMDGKVKYHDVYTQPGEGNRQLIKGASALGSLALGAGSFAKAVEGAEITMTYRDEAGVLRESIVRQADTGKQLQSAALGAGSAVMGQLFNKYGSRFNAMRQNKDFSYIYAKDPSGEKVLVKVRKADGVEVDKLIFKNDRPIYEVDPATQTVYYVLDNAVQVFYNKK
ncbi:outer membrane protein assembly factor BamB family protein [Flectobacillus longus]|uniref:outer membrane protein assembly factor BamB family protein n=1 Tax=Flectobacillus longus TaxID=2984207 RepID=UPI0024B79A98|nr:PQQ-binding-like beta-propeller repeat protein [Flectobacillus longus]MDI9877940.1 PQQ-binding-like beta-propeller repeat protein [Flectobacillus longus]